MTITWDPCGHRRLEDFDISEDGVLTFDIGGDSEPDASVSPNFESPRGTAADNTNIYVVTVTATSPAGANGSTNTDMEEVTVEVTDVAEDGEVTWTVAVGVHAAGATLLTQFIVGAELVAGVDRWRRHSKWHHQIPVVQVVEQDLAGYGHQRRKLGTGSNYTVASDDVGSYIRVVTYYYEAEGSNPEIRVPGLRPPGVGGCAGGQ